MKEINKLVTDIKARPDVSEAIADVRAIVNKRSGTKWFDLSEKQKLDKELKQAKDRLRGVIRGAQC